jgi:hypothetical protein
MRTAVGGGAKAVMAARSGHPLPTLLIGIVFVALVVVPLSANAACGAPIPQNSALTSAGAELYLTPRFTLLVKFDGEFAPGSQTYAGSGTLRYTW